MNTFNGPDFLFLNPELTAFLDIKTIESAQSFYNTIGGSNSHLATNINIIPANYNGEIFISSSRDLANISALSRVIERSMSNVGLTPTQIARKQRYVASIYQDLVYTGANEFVLTSYNAFNGFNTNSLNIGDEIKVIDRNSTELFFTINGVNSNSFEVTPTIYNIFQTSNYLIVGIKCTDFDRISQINYARIFGGYSNIDSNGDIMSFIPGGTSNTNFVTNVADPTFNASLYKMLYTDARSFNDEQAYVDWVNKRKNEVIRIKNVDDVAFGNGNLYTNFNFLNISSNLLFRGKFIDGIISNIDPSSCNMPGDSNKLPTEYAIKNYADYRFGNIQTLGNFSNIAVAQSLNVNSNSTFKNDLNVWGSLYVGSNSAFSNNLDVIGNMYIHSNLDVVNTVTMRNSFMLTNGNATFSNGAIVNGSMSVTGNLYNARIGLGYMGSYLTGNQGVDIIQAQNYNDNSDVRIKKDICAITPRTCLDILCGLNIKEFNYNYGIEKVDRKREIGLIAQEVEEVFPEAVYETVGYLPDIMQGAMIEYDRIVLDNVFELVENKEIKLVIDGKDEVYVTIKRRLERSIYTIAPALYFNTRCLIYGYKTQNLKNVDYKHLFVMALGAIRELRDKIVDQSS